MPHAIPFTLLTLLLATPAFADDCNSPLPRRGTGFSGPVTAVLDGDSLCVGSEDGGIEVRIADFYAPEIREPGGPQARRTLEAIAFQRDVTCEAGKRSWDRVVAVCRLPDGTTIGDAMRAAGVAEGGRGWPLPSGRN